MNNFPSIGDIVMSPHDKFKDSTGVNRYDQPIADGKEIDESTSPILWGKSTIYGANTEVILPNGSENYIPLVEPNDEVGITGRVDTGIVYERGGATIQHTIFDMPPSLTENTVVFSVDAPLNPTDTFIELCRLDYGSSTYTAVGTRNNRYYSKSKRGSSGSGGYISKEYKEGEVDIMLMYQRGNARTSQVILGGVDEQQTTGSLTQYAYPDNIILSLGWFKSLCITPYVDTTDVWTYLEVVDDTNKRYLPDIQPKDPLVPYKIVADLTENA